MVTALFLFGPDGLEAVGCVKLSSSSNPYSTLGISTGTTEKEIKTAYKNLAKKWHPDRNPDSCEECEERMQETIEAFEKLKAADFKLSFSDTSAEKWEEVIEQISPHIIEYAAWFESTYESATEAVNTWSEKDPPQKREKKRRAARDEEL